MDLRHPRFRPETRGHRVAAANEGIARKSVGKIKAAPGRCGDGIEVDWRRLTVELWTAELSVRRNNSVREFSQDGAGPGSLTGSECGGKSE